MSDKKSGQHLTAAQRQEAMAGLEHEIQKIANKMQAAHAQLQPAGIRSQIAVYTYEQIQRERAELVERLTVERDQWKAKYEMSVAAVELADKLSACEFDRDAWKAAEHEANAKLEDLRRYVGSKVTSTYDRLRAKERR